MNEELQEWWRNRRHSPSALSHRSRDSGFSDSDAGPAQRPASPTAKPEKQTPTGQQRVRRTRASRERPESVTHTCTEPTETATRTCGNAESLDPGGDRPQATQFGDVESYWTDNSELTARYVGSCEDLSHMPPPTHASTPKSARSCRPGTKHRVDINSNAPVKHWLKEVRNICDPECMTTLQSKSLTSDLSRQVSIITAVTTNSVRMLFQKTKIISSEFEKVNRLISNNNIEDLTTTVSVLIENIAEFLEEYSFDETKAQTDKKGLESACIILNSTIRHHNLVNIKSSIKALATAFTQRIDQLLLGQIKRLVNIFENENSHASLMCTLSGLAGLGLQAAHLANLLARCSGITALLALCINSQSASVRTAALRILATVCCSSSSIMQFEMGGGLEIMCDILSDHDRGELEQCEAASVIAQVTAPWLDHGQTVHNIEKHLSALISALTELIKRSASHETLLVCAAALANISWAEPRSVWLLVENSSAGALLVAVRSQGPKACVFLREQAATLLANMSAVSEIRSHLAQHRAVPALLCFLQVSHSPLHSPAEIGAAYRVQHKSAIALSRLCSEPEAANQVIQLQGVSSLVRLCREERERNNSDGVLVACLATLRKIASNCGRQVISEQNAKELIDPKLLESFLIYSSKQDNSG